MILIVSFIKKDNRGFFITEQKEKMKCQIK